MEVTLDFGKYRLAFEDAKRAGVVDELAHAHAVACMFLSLAFWPHQVPKVVSGHRDAQKQLNMQRRWDAGDRAGLVTRPASQSWHLVGRGLDVGVDVPSFPVYVAMMERQGVQWGGRFRTSDPVHFQLPNADQPPSINQLLRA